MGLNNKSPVDPVAQSPTMDTSSHNNRRRRGSIGKSTTVRTLSQGLGSSPPTTCTSEASKTTGAPRQPRRYCSSSEESDVDAGKNARVLKTLPADMVKMPSRRMSLPAFGGTTNNGDEDSIVCQYANKKFTGIDVYSPHVRRGSLGVSSLPVKAEKAKAKYGVKMGYGFDSSKSSDSEQETKTKRSSSTGTRGVVLGLEAPALGCFLKTTKEQIKKILDERSLGSGTKSSNEEILGIGPCGRRVKLRRKSMGDASVSTASQFSGSQHSRVSVTPTSGVSETNKEIYPVQRNRRRRGSTGTNLSWLSDHIDSEKKPKTELADGQSLGGISALSLGSRSSGFESRSSEEEFEGVRSPTFPRHRSTPSKSYSDWARQYKVESDNESESGKQREFGLLDDLGYISEEHVEDLLAFASKENVTGKERIQRRESSSSWASEYTVSTEENPKTIVGVPSREELGYDDEQDDDHLFSDTVRMAEGEASLALLPTLDLGYGDLNADEEIHEMSDSSFSLRGYKTGYCLKNARQRDASSSSLRMDTRLNNNSVLRQRSLSVFATLSSQAA